MTMPKRCYFKHGAWYYVTPANNWVRLGESEEVAQLAYDALIDAPTENIKYGPVYGNARTNAATRGITFLLTKDDFKTLVDRAAGRCEITGIRFSAVKHPTGIRRPFMPSIDRVSSYDCYHANNVRLICSCVNYAMNEWGLEFFDRIATYRRTHLRQSVRLSKNRPVSQNDKGV